MKVSLAQHLCTVTALAIAFGVGGYWAGWKRHAWIADPAHAMAADLQRMKAAPDLESKVQIATELAAGSPDAGRELRELALHGDHTVDLMTRKAAVMALARSQLNSEVTMGPGAWDVLPDYEHEQELTAFCVKAAAEFLANQYWAVLSGIASTYYVTTDGTLRREILTMLAFYMRRSPEEVRAILEGGDGAPNFLILLADEPPRYKSTLWPALVQPEAAPAAGDQ